MNEKALLETWQRFANQNKLEFTTEDRPNIQGVITEYKLTLEADLTLNARLGKTGSYHQAWSKLVLENGQHTLKEQTIKTTGFSLFRKSDFEKKISVFMKAIRASELNITQGQVTLKFDRILNSDSELTSMASIAKELKELIR